TLGYSPTGHTVTAKYVDGGAFVDTSTPPTGLKAYYDSDGDKTVTITKATLTVTANPQTKIYGAGDPTLTYSVTGFVNGDTSSILSGALNRAAGETVAGGPYAITQGSLSAGSNYSISFTGANLTITTATLTVTANPQTKI